MRNAFRINQEQYDSVKNIALYPFRKDIIIDGGICVCFSDILKKGLYFKEGIMCQSFKKKIHDFNFLKFLKEFGGYDKLNIDLTGYCVEVENEEESRELQEYAFSKGFGWLGSGNLVSNLDFKFLFFYENKLISLNRNKLHEIIKIKFKDLLTLHQDKEEVLVVYDKPGKIIISGKELELKKIITDSDLINLGSKNMELEEELICEISVKKEMEERLCEISELQILLEDEIKELQLKIKERDEPKVGDLCVFSDDDFETKEVGEFFGINTSNFPYITSLGVYHKRCTKITDENIINFFKNLK